MKTIEIKENGINIVFEINDANEIKLLHFSSLEFNRQDIKSVQGTNRFNLVEVNITGYDRPYERHGTKYIITAPGYRMKFKDLRDSRNGLGRKLEIDTFDEESGLLCTTHWQFYDGLSVIRSYTELKNEGTKPFTVDYVSSFALTGIEKEGILSQNDKLRLTYAHNSWQRELQFRTYTLSELGMELSQPYRSQRSSKPIALTNTGNWSTKEYLPMGHLENIETGSSLFWQIEHNGSWHWEISDVEGNLYLQLSGPTETESHWFKTLKPGETFCSVPCAVGVSMGGIDESMAQLTNYRRAIRRKNDDNEKLAVIFNDYMNCLWADPTTEKELPLIDAAHEAGCEYFCIDAGWYADGYWWDWVGEWEESRKRFPNGMKEVTDYIRSKGMIPGAWLELEVMGIKCPLVDTVADDSWFFTRHQNRIHDRSRYQLDFRNPKVIEHADKVIEKLVNVYGIGYIKMDYNIEPGIGTEQNCESVGQGLLEHERAYLKWLDSIFVRYPDLIIENCSSGGLRMDYALLSRHSIQSTSDEDDYRMYCTIAANAPAALCPEQAAIWSYPMQQGDNEEVVFNMVNSMLLRIHQSGHLAQISKERKELVWEGIRVYKEIRQDIKKAVAFWPLGLSKFTDEWVALGLKTEDKAYVAVWKRVSSSDTVILPISFLNGRDATARLIYPSFGGCEYNLSKNGNLSVRLSGEYKARLFEITF